MRLFHNSMIFMLFLVLCGCTVKHDYVWNEYSIRSERLVSKNSFTEGQEIRIIKGKSDDSNKLFAKIAHHHYYGSDQFLTDGIADQLAKEMAKMRLTIKNQAEKSLEITVNSSNFKQGGFSSAVTLGLMIKFGNGKAKSYTVRNSSPGPLYRIYNGAVALAVIEIINDPEVLTYING